jgi:hypothetical protein
LLIVILSIIRKAFLLRDFFVRAHQQAAATCTYHLSPVKAVLRRFCVFDGEFDAVLATSVAI